MRQAASRPGGAPERPTLAPPAAGGETRLVGSIPFQCDLHCLVEALEPLERATAHGTRLAGTSGGRGSGGRGSGGRASGGDESLSDAAPRALVRCLALACLWLLLLRLAAWLPGSSGCV